MFVFYHITLAKPSLLRYDEEVRKILLFVILFFLSSLPVFADIDENVTLDISPKTVTNGENVHITIDNLPKENHSYTLLVKSPVRITSLEIQTEDQNDPNPCHPTSVGVGWTDMLCIVNFPDRPYKFLVDLNTSPPVANPSDTTDVTLELTDSSSSISDTFTVQSLAPTSTPPPPPTTTPTPSICSTAAGLCSKTSECHGGTGDCTSYTCEGTKLGPGDIPIVFGRCKSPATVCKKEAESCNGDTECTGGGPVGSACFNYRCLPDSVAGGAKVCKPKAVPPQDILTTLCPLAAHTCDKNEDCQIGSTCTTYTCEKAFSFGPIQGQGLCKTASPICSKEAEICNTDTDCQAPGGACTYYSCIPIDPISGGTKICKVGIPLPTPIRSKLLDCNKIGNNDPTKIAECERCLGPNPANPEGVPTALGCLKTNLASLTGNIFGILLGIAGGIALILIIYSGYRMSVSAGNPEALQGARETLTAAIVGLLFIIFAFVILQIIGFDILQIPQFKP